MKRWHDSRELMLSRWRREIANHETKWSGAPLPSVPPTTCDPDPCHCYRGMGFYYKKDPYDCGRPHCGICHSEKFFPGARRLRDERDAFEREWAATGGW